MRKFNYVLLTLLLTVAVIFFCERYAKGMPDCTGEAFGRQFLGMTRGSLTECFAPTQHPSIETRLESQQLATKDSDEKKPPQDGIPAGSRAQIPWEELYEKKPPKEDPPAGSRGGACPIAPAVAGKIGVVWSDRPLFLWHGRVGKIEVHPQDSEEVLWSQTFQKPNDSAIYGGKALQPGQSYDQMIFDPRERLMAVVTFQVIPREERDRIAADLTRLEAQLKQKKATAEKIAYDRSNYFASRQMWADVLREAYEVKNPSPALTKFKQTIPDKFCY